MDMNAEYVNVFIEKMRAVITDLQSKLLLAETEIHFKDKKINELNSALNKVEKEVKVAEVELDSF
jgi:peptidoglycan hydrolase CwlO-like protein